MSETRVTIEKPVQTDRQLILVAIGLIALTLIVFAPVLTFQFINVDDNVYVTGNAHVQQGLSWSNINWALTALDAANWHPITWLSHMLDVTLFGSNAGGHHATSLLIHTLNVIVLFFLLRAMTGAFWRSAIVAAWFAIHPLALESVAWVAERKNVLSTLFLLLTIGAYVWYARKPRPERYLVVALFLALGLMSKAMLVTVPFALLLLDYWPLERLGLPAPRANLSHEADESKEEDHPDLQRRRSVVLRTCAKRFAEKLPLLAMAAVTAVLTVKAQIRDNEIKIVSLPSRVANAALACTTYLQQMVWPTRLAILYPFRDRDLFSWPVIASIFFICLLSGLAIWQVRTRPYLAVGWFWYLGTLVPVSGLIHIGDLAHADRYSYVPLLGIFIAIVWAIAEIAKQVAALRAPLIAAACLSVAALAMTTHHDVAYWHDGISISEHAIAVTGPNCLMERALGEAFYVEGRTDDALQHLKRSAEIAPTDVAFFGIGTILFQRQKLDEAAFYYQKALDYPGDPATLAQIHNNLAVIEMQHGALAEAEKHFQASLALDPGSARHRVAYGWLLANEKRYDEAISQYKEILTHGPDPLAYYSLGSALEAQHKLPQAVEAYRQTLLLAPGFQQAQVRLNEIALKQP